MMMHKIYITGVVKISANPHRLGKPFQNREVLGLEVVTKNDLFYFTFYPDDEMPEISGIKRIPVEWEKADVAEAGKTGENPNAS
jgi:hypothetical protein